MMQRGGRLAFTLFELLLALALLAALSSLVIGVLLRTDRDHDLLQVQLEALVDVSCMHAQRERTALMVWGNRMWSSRGGGCLRRAKSTDVPSHAAWSIVMGRASDLGTHRS